MTSCVALNEGKVGKERERESRGLELGGEWELGNDEGKSSNEFRKKGGRTTYRYEQNPLRNTTLSR